MLEKVHGDGWRTIEINVASCPDERAFVKKLAEATDERMRSLPGRALGAAATGMAELLGRSESVQVPLPASEGVGLTLRASGGEEWSDVADDTLRLMSKAGDRWLVYMDELPIFLYGLIRGDAEHGVQRVRRFLDWFRNDVRALADCRQMRWLITGSVGLDTLVQRHLMADTINSLRHESLTPFSTEQAVAMVRLLARRYDMYLSEDGCSTLVTAVHWPQPYYLQLVFHHLRRITRRHPSRPPIELIKDAIDESVQPGADNDFHHWEQRLRVQLGEIDAGHAIALLSLAARSPEGQRAESLLVGLQGRTSDDTDDVQHRKFVELRDVLLRDAYWAVSETADVRRYAFCLEPLRLWWLRRHEL